MIKICLKSLLPASIMQEKVKQALKGEIFARKEELVVKVSWQWMCARAVYYGTHHRDASKHQPIFARTPLSLSVSLSYSGAGLDNVSQNQLVICRARSE